MLDKYVRSQTSFYLGLASGVAIISTIGFLIFLGLYVREELGINTLPDNNEVVADTYDTANTDNNDADSQPTDNTADKVDVKVSSTDHIRGNKNAPVTIVEFSDYQCPFCSRFHDTMKQVMQNYPDKVRWVFKHFPLEQIHPYAKKAAEAAECAGEQNKFWEYTDYIYANQSSLNNEFLPTAAKAVGINTTKFSSCLSSGKYASKISADQQQGQSIGVNGTPGNFINGTPLMGAQPYSAVESAIKNQLNQ